MCHANIRDQCRKKNCLRDENNDKQRTTTMRNISARIGKEDVEKEVSLFEERYQELGEEIKHEAAAEKIQYETK